MAPTELAIRSRRPRSMPSRTGLKTSLAVLLNLVVRAEAAAVVHYAAEVCCTEARQRGVEKQLTVDIYLLRACIRRQRIMIPQHQVGVLSNINRTGAIVHADDPRWVQSDHSDRLVLGGPAVMHHLAG